MNYIFPFAYFNIKTKPSISNYQKFITISRKIFRTVHFFIILFD